MTAFFSFSSCYVVWSHVLEADICCFTFKSNQMKQMDEVKISKKSKVGILPFVAEFEEFAALAESIFKNAERRGDLDKAYIKLIRAVFVSGKSSEVVMVTKIIVSSYLYIIFLQLILHGVFLDYNKPHDQYSAEILFFFYW